MEYLGGAEGEGKEQAERSQQEWDLLPVQHIDLLRGFYEGLIQQTDARVNGGPSEL
jgi:hypothetical protein